ncbi:hypothetical protein TNIN_258613 [Trichonephila inaurata madagascariensis]|uniref:Uncharacterized protein n=1 Tax=Trichonephila inaurata madagascariensis TaxID=2747483 RepID=A0A8X6WY14_9ARAC|nr:hypothetical protein TNIN_258613 [Trichonephila inaurata madagascariensis]
MFKILSRKTFITSITPINIRYISYQQGQSPEPNTREYFYFIDHQGMGMLTEESDDPYGVVIDGTCH